MEFRNAGPMNNSSIPTHPLVMCFDVCTICDGYNATSALPLATNAVAAKTFSPTAACTSSVRTNSSLSLTSRGGRVNPNLVLTGDGTRFMWGGRPNTGKEEASSNVIDPRRRGEGVGA